MLLCRYAICWDLFVDQLEVNLIDGFVYYLYV